MTLVVLEPATEAELAEIPRAGAEDPHALDHYTEVKSVYYATGG